MVKVFSISCIFGNQRQPFDIYIGKPERSHHPVHWQKSWLASAKNGQIPEDFLNSLQRLFESAIKNGADPEEVCEYALIAASRTANKDSNGSIIKINSTIKTSDIDRYAEEFQHLKKKNLTNNPSFDNNCVVTQQEAPNIQNNAEENIKEDLQQNINNLQNNVQNIIQDDKQVEQISQNPDTQINNNPKGDNINTEKAKNNDDDLKKEIVPSAQIGKIASSASSDKDSIYGSDDDIL